MSHLETFKIIRLALLPVIALLASCQSGGSRGQTQYLEAFNPASLPNSSMYNADQVSYWDGDGLSGSPSITIDLSDQKAYFYKGGTLAGAAFGPPEAAAGQARVLQSILHSALEGLVVIVWPGVTRSVLRA
jgi:hypothetical protein